MDKRDDDKHPHDAASSTGMARRPTAALSALGSISGDLFESEGPNTHERESANI